VALDARRARHGAVLARVRRLARAFAQLLVGKRAGRALGLIDLADASGEPEARARTRDVTEVAHVVVRAHAHPGLVRVVRAVCVARFRAGGVFRARRELFRQRARRVRPVAAGARDAADFPRKARVAHARPDLVLRDGHPRGAHLAVPAALVRALLHEHAVPETLHVAHAPREELPARAISPVVRRVVGHELAPPRVAAGVHLALRP